MNKILFRSIIFIAIVGLFISCKKDDPASSDYFLKVTKDGVSQTWTTGLAGELGPDLGDPNYFDLGVAGQSDNGSESMNIALQKMGTTFTTGVYDSNISNDVTMSIIYGTGMPNTPKFYSMDDDGVVQSRYIVTITSITDDAIEGSFTGNVLMDFDNNKISVTEGQFRVKRIR